MRFRLPIGAPAFLGAVGSDRQLVGTNGMRSVLCFPPNDNATETFRRLDFPHFS